MSPAYYASKAALFMLTRQAALDYGAKAIRCNVVCPGWVRTGMMERELDVLAEMMGTDREGASHAIAKHIPLGRINTRRLSGDMRIPGER